MSLRIYKKKLEYSYTFGLFPTIELLEKKPGVVKTVLLSGENKDVEATNRIKKLCNKNRINFDVGPHAIHKLAPKENTHAIGVFEKYKTKLNDTEAHVMLVNPSDMGNIGTIIRTMVGFGLKNLVIIRPGVDIFDPKVVRTTMGALFDINFEYFDTFRQYESVYKNHIKYPFVLKGKTDLRKVKFTEPAVLIFGNEGSGLDKFYEQMDNTVRISHTRNIDSLNLAVAVSLALYQYSNSSYSE